jgi:predicted nucleotidyltransferase
MPSRAADSATGKAEAFANKLQATYGPALVSVLLYGSAARGEYREGVSDLNLLVVLSDLNLQHLERASAMTREWAKAGNPPPLMLSETEWRRSADVFPIEYSDIREAHVLLAGSDPFRDITIHREHLRLQLEHELRTKKIQLREGFLLAGKEGEEVAALLARSLPTFLTLFRAILRLGGVPVPGSPETLIEATGSQVGFDPAPVLEILRKRSAVKKFSVEIAGPLAAGYLTAVEKAETWLDGFNATALAPDQI